MPEYTLRIRRYTPESGDAAHWQDFTIDLDGHRSVLDGILQARDREDGVEVEEGRGQPRRPDPGPTTSRPFGRLDRGEDRLGAHVRGRELTRRSGSA